MTKVKSLKLPVVVLLSAATLVGCSAIENITGGQQAAESSTSESEQGKGSQQAESDPLVDKLDSGRYPKRYGQQSPEQSPERYGFIAESNDLGNNMLLPVEVDRALTSTSDGHTVAGAGHYALTLTSSEYELMKSYEDKMQSGFMRSARNEDKSRSVLIIIQRYDSEATAKEVAQKLFTESLKEQPDTETGFGGPGGTPENFTLPGDVSYAGVSNSENGDKTSRFTTSTYNEYMFYTYSSSTNDEALQANRTFLKDYINQQIPLLESLQTHKTEAGFGDIDQWVGLDPAGMVRYVVRPIANADGEIEDVTYVNAALNPRGIAGFFTESDVMLGSLKQTGVTDGAIAETLVVKTRNKDGADALVSAMISSDMASDHVEYDEPQQIPNTRCVYFDEPSTTTYSCYMKYGDFVAMGSQSELVDKRTDNSVDAKTKLSQLMAAQYKIFKDAEKNPDGTSSQDMYKEVGVDTKKPGESSESEKPSAPATEEETEGNK